MKTLFLAASAAAMAAALPASASVVTIGNGYARSCYLAADARRATAQTMDECNNALNLQSLSARDRVATFVNRGILRMIRDDRAAAKADFERAISLDASQPETWLNLGILQYNEREFGSALQMFERAIALGTTDPALAYYARGLAHEDVGNVKAAYADLTKARALRPDWAPPARELQRFQLVQR